MRTKTIFFDVDGTLIKWKGPQGPGMPSSSAGYERNERVIEDLRRLHVMGHKTIVWSGMGEDHARHIVAALGLGNWVDVIISKPNIVFDDMGWEWTRAPYRILIDPLSDYKSPL